MSALDAAFLYFDRPHSPLSIGCVAVLDGPVSRGELLQHLAGRLERIDRYRQHPVPAPFALAHPSWAADPDFDLRNHVHHLGVPRPGGTPELCDAVAELIDRPMDPSRPLWEFHLLDGLCDDRSAVLHRVHHCMLDGVAGAGLLDTLLDATCTPGDSPTRRFEPRTADGDPPLGELGRALSDAASIAWRRSAQALDLLRHPEHLRRGLDPARELGSWALRRMLNAPTALPWNGPVGPRRSLAFTGLSLADAREIREAAGCTVNDVVLCVLAGGLRRYLESVGIDPERQPVVAAVPVNMRSAADDRALGNRLGMLFVPLMLGSWGESQRLARTAAVTRRLKQGGGHSAMAALLAAADLLPPAVLAWLGRHAHVPTLAGVIATNVHGPDSPRYFAGHRVEALHPIVPITDGLGLGLAVLSYAGTLQIGLDADAELVPDLEKLRAGIEESMTCLMAAH